MRIILFNLLLFLCFRIYSQESAGNSKIGKKEFELTGIGLHDNHGVSFGIESIFRFPLKSNAKLGGGIFLRTDDKYSSLHYGALVDAAAFIGSRQKWSMNGDFGYDFFKGHHNSSNSYYALESDLKANLMFNFSINYRAIISKKLQVVTGGFVNFTRFKSDSHFTYFNPPSEKTASSVQYYGGGGIRLGFIL